MALYSGLIDAGASRWERLCEVCLGEKCEKCKVSGWTLEDGSPLDQITDEGKDLFSAYRFLKEFNLLPAPGPWLYQTEKFRRALDFVSRVTQAYQARRRQQEADLNRMREAMERMRHE